MRASGKKLNPVLSMASDNNNGKHLDKFFLWLAKFSVLPGEVIIVDDGSQDNSIRKLQSYNGTLNLKCFLLEFNKGLSSALNYAVEKSTSEYSVRIIPGDLIPPDRIEKQFYFLPEAINANKFNTNDNDYLASSN